jgi:hypothetical protein
MNVFYLFIKCNENTAGLKLMTHYLSKSDMTAYGYEYIIQVYVALNIIYCPESTCPSWSHPWAWQCHLPWQEETK